MKLKITPPKTIPAALLKQIGEIRGRFEAIARTIAPTEKEIAELEAFTREKHTELNVLREEKTKGGVAALLSETKVPAILAQLRQAEDLLEIEEGKLRVFVNQIRAAVVELQEAMWIAFGIPKAAEIDEQILESLLPLFGSRRAAKRMAEVPIQIPAQEALRKFFSGSPLLAHTSSTEAIHAAARDLFGKMERLEGGEAIVFWDSDEAQKKAASEDQAAAEKAKEFEEEEKKEAHAAAESKRIRAERESGARAGFQRARTEHMEAEGIGALV